MLEQDHRFARRARGRQKWGLIFCAAVIKAGRSTRRDREGAAELGAQFQPPSSSTVPEPTIASFTSALMARMQSGAALVRKVISRTGRPPPTSALASGTASATSSMTSTGMTGARRRRAQDLFAVRPSLHPENRSALIGATDLTAEGHESSRPTPKSLADKSAVTGARDAHSAASTSTSRRPDTASSLTMSPSQILAIGAAIGGFRSHMDGGRHFAGSARHAAVGDERHAMPPILEHAQGRHQLVELRHAVGLRPLEAHHGDEVAVSSPALKAFCNSSCEWKTRAGASITCRSFGTAELLITARPRSPSSTAMPPRPVRRDLRSRAGPLDRHSPSPRLDQARPSASRRGSTR